MPIQTSFTYGSLCSGLGSESVAWKDLGWKCLWYAEINAFCKEVLKHHYPDVPNLGNVNKVRHDLIEGTRKIRRPDLVVGGTPCQSFSLNNSTESGRKGLDDKRGVLALTFIRIVEVLKPTWVIWENVPNALRVDEGRAFGSIIGAMANIGYGWGFRVLDLQDFGLPQRRKRLFVVGYLGDCRPAVATLFRALPAIENKAKAKEVQQEGMARVDGWTGDETPKRGIGVCPTLRSIQGGEGAGVIVNGRLRVLTSIEWERLQGFPDGYTNVPFKGKPPSDRVRQRAIGNSFPPPILRWIGEGIEFVHSHLKATVL